MGSTEPEGGTRMYVAPEIIEIGTVRDITLAGDDTDFTDSSSAANGPKGKLTFS